MKKVVSIVLFIGCMAGIDAMAVQIKNNLAYGVAKRDPATGALKIVNICTMDVVNCIFGTVTRDGVAIPRENLRVSLGAYGTLIQPGETKDLPLSGQIYITAYYGDVAATFTAIVSSPTQSLEFPADFKLVP